MKLTKAQREALGYWYILARTATAGYKPTWLRERKPTLEALHRLGLTDRPYGGHPVSAWAAEVTPEGEEVARKIAIELGLIEGEDEVPAS